MRLAAGQNGACLPWLAFGRRPCGTGPVPDCKHAKNTNVPDASTAAPAAAFYIQVLVLRALLASPTLWRQAAEPAFKLLTRLHRCSHGSVQTIMCMAAAAQLWPSQRVLPMHAAHAGGVYTRIYEH